MCLRTDCAEPLYIAELLPVSRAPVKGGVAERSRPVGMRSEACDPQDRRTLDRVAGGEIIARKKRFGQVRLSTAGIFWLMKNLWKGAFTF